MTAYIDQYFKDAAGAVHFLSAQDQANAAAPGWAGPTLPDPAWTAIAADEAHTIANPPPSAAQLLAYAQARRQVVADGGITVNVGTTAAPVACAANTSASGVSDLAVMLLQAEASGSTTFYQSGGDVTVTTAQIQTIQQAVASFIGATWATLNTVSAAISAGTVATTAEIDAASWPATS
ncbi:MAG TPA: hypothetical protein VFF98_14850 [Novosphingobium sp.]|nr:hypothetical protein [Novosphingobium sp.]HZV11481.1 hypothetical protein [Novosphingobium sp.]